MALTILGIVAQFIVAAIVAGVIAKGAANLYDKYIESEADKAMAAI